MDTNHRTAPRWIAEALTASLPSTIGSLTDEQEDADRLAVALIERLPIEAMTQEFTAFPNGERSREEATSIVARITRVLSEDDPEVVTLTELYQGACRALDAAGVPYAVDGDPQHITIEAVAGEMAPRKPTEAHQVADHPGTTQLDLAARIRWLAQQRPTRIDLQRVEAERDAARVSGRNEAAADMIRVCGERDDLKRELDAARTEAATLSATPLAHERDLLRQLYDDAIADLEHQREAQRAADEALEVRDARVTTLEDSIRALAESDLPAGDLRRALGELIGIGARDRIFAAVDRQVLRNKVADQAAYIEQLEVEIDALEDEIWEDVP